MKEDIAELEADPLVWVATLFPQYAYERFGDHHAEFWDWVWAIRAGVRPNPLCAIWSRGFAKSTNAEMAVVGLGARKVRTYGLYVCESQDKADDHVQNIGGMLESVAVNAFYPDMADRAVGKFGQSKGWRRNRLRTRSGLVVDALGLDSTARGAKVDEQRPDFIIIDDVDGEHDSKETTAKKVKSLTRKILPAGSSDLAVLFVQNLIHPDSIASQLVDGRADFLQDRIISGPVPAILDMEVEQDNGRFTIVGGRATWAGMDLVTCQGIIDDVGITSFQAEYQHAVDAPPGGMFDHLEYAHCARDEVPTLERVVCWVDPAVTDKDTSDSQAIQIDGLGVNGTIYRLWSWEQRSSPLNAIVTALRKAVEYGASELGVETDQGGDTWESVYLEACEQVLTEYDEVFLDECERADRQGRDHPPYEPPRLPPFKDEKAGAGYGPKQHRAGKMLARYETQNGFVHVMGTHKVLESALHRFPKTKPYDLVDAAYWAFESLSKPVPGPVKVTPPTGRIPNVKAGQAPTVASGRGRGVRVGVAGRRAPKRPPAR